MPPPLQVEHGRVSVDERPAVPTLPIPRRRPYARRGGYGGYILPSTVVIDWIEAPNAIVIGIGGGRRVPG